MKKITTRLKSIGTDPEVFIMKGDQVVPCVGIIKGSKNKGLKVTEHVSVLEDNVCLEWNVSPSFSKEEFIEKNFMALDIISNGVLPVGYSIDIKSVHKFESHQLRSEQANIFGCEPDYNAYTLRLNTAPDPRSKYRTAAGHLHIGISSIESLNQVDKVEIIRLLDACIGTYCVVHEDDSNKIRRSMYGSAGSFREKEYGLEYRTPSNFWVNDKDHMSNIYDLAEMALYLFDNDIIVGSTTKQKVIDSINGHDKETARIVHDKLVNVFKGLKEKENAGKAFSFN